MKKKRFTLLLILVINAGIVCSQQKSYQTKTVNYGGFTIIVPLGWKPLDAEYEDSAVGNIQIDKKSFISFDLGRYSASLNEDDFDDDYELMDGKVYLIYKSLTTSNHQRLKYFGKANEITLEKLRRYKVSYLLIDGRRAKLITPKKVGAGFTGIYIDSLYNADGVKIKFTISGRNLTTVQQMQFLIAIKTLRFYNLPTILKK